MKRFPAILKDLQKLKQNRVKYYASQEKFLEKFLRENWQFKSFHFIFKRFSKWFMLLFATTQG